MDNIDSKTIFGIEKLNISENHASESGKLASDIDIMHINLFSTDPMKIFQAWFQEAKLQPDLNELPETMTLATVRADGGPSARSVLLRGLDDEGFKMYWDKRSRKSLEIESDVRGALVFCWHLKNSDGTKEIRQARIEGIIEELPEDDNTKYFNEEPLLAKVRAVVCHQSRVVTDDRVLLVQETNRLWTAVNKEGLTLHKPTHWGGYRLKPTMIEFYKGKRDSINDRIRFRRSSSKDEQSVFTDLPDGVNVGQNGWVYERLEP